MDSLINHPFVIVGFILVILFMLVLDLGLLNKKSHSISNKEALYWSVAWVSLSMLFSLLIWQTISFEKFTQYQAAYWIEKALSVDNLFVFILVFNFFNVLKKYQHKVLFWGIIGAIVFRAFFIFTGVEMIKLSYLPEFTILGKSIKINLILTIFGAFLIYTGIKYWFVEEDNKEKDFSKSPGARVIYKFFKVSKEYDEDKFFIKENGAWVATPLLIVLAVIEFTDLIFAVDSIPAIFAIAPNDPFILYTSNIFAILGLRSLYFLLANYIDLFSKLKYGLAIILTFIGFKMLIDPFLHISSPVSLFIVAGILILSVVLSIRHNKRMKKNAR